MPARQEEEHSRGSCCISKVQHLGEGGAMLMQSAVHQEVYCIIPWWGPGSNVMCFGVSLLHLRVMLTMCAHMLEMWRIK